MRTRKSKVKQKGGKPIASGGYGCVFELDDPKLVGKINFVEPMWMEHEGMTFERFMGLQRAIRTIDPNERYFITIREAKPIKVTDEKVQECYTDWAKKATEGSIENYKDKKLSTLNYYTMTRVQPTNVAAWSELQWQHALTGMNLLHDYNICHNDIHAGNFGLKDGNPVYIDMDGASYAASPSLVDQEGVKRFALYNTIQPDILNFEKMFKKYWKSSKNK